MKQSLIGLWLLLGCCPNPRPTVVHTVVPQNTTTGSDKAAHPKEVSDTNITKTPAPSIPSTQTKGQPAFTDAQIKAQLEDFDFTGDAEPDYEALMAGRDKQSSTIVEELRGRSSYYADKFHGRTTANGEVYHKKKLTAASRDLRFGTIVRVIRESGPSVIVRVNDRGPFRDHSRILDLSRAAAKQLQMEKAGVVNIRAHILYVPDKPSRQHRRRR